MMLCAALMVVSAALPIRAGGSVVQDGARLLDDMLGGYLKQPSSAMSAHLYWVDKTGTLYYAFTSAQSGYEIDSSAVELFTYQGQPGHSGTVTLLVFNCAYPIVYSSTLFGTADDSGLMRWGDPHQFPNPTFTKLDPANEYGPAVNNVGILASLVCQGSVAGLMTARPRDAAEKLIEENETVLSPALQ